MYNSIPMWSVFKSEEVIQLFIRAWVITLLYTQLTRPTYQLTHIVHLSNKPV